MATTTPIADVSPACAALWSPYGVTKVPPANLADGTPAPPAVVNETNGAVSDAQANAWALAINRSAVLYRWAEDNGQQTLLPTLLKSSLIPGKEQQALAVGAVVHQPDCSSFGTVYDVFAIGAQGQQYFAAQGQAVNDLYVVSVRFPGPCQILASYPDGHTTVLFSYAGAGRTVFAGSMRNSPLFGDVWYSDGAADCGSQSPPAVWCPA